MNKLSIINFIQHRSRKSRLLQSVVLVFVLIIGLALGGDFLLPNNQKGFTRVPIRIHDYDLNDLGVVDANQDGYLDLFTTNHSAQQSLMLGDGTGKFEDVFWETGLGQDRQVPAIENTDWEPLSYPDGVSVYRQDNTLHIVYEASKTEIDRPVVSGSLEIDSKIEIEVSTATDTELVQKALPTGAISSKLSFVLEPQAHLAISATVEIPHKFSFSKDISLDRISLGRLQKHPSNHQFELMWRDRHSMAWTDLNADRQLDVFIGRGGIKGEMHGYPYAFFDELFVSTPQQNWDDQASTKDMIKGNCPGRQAAWIDADQNGLLDIYQICGRSTEDPKNYPNQLFRQTQSGQFEEIASSVNLGLPGNGEFIWLDADRDGDPDVLVTENTELFLYVNDLYTKGIFTPKSLATIINPYFQQFSIADYDQDLDLDVYLANRERAYLLQKGNDDFEVVEPKTLGLPNHSLCANWVDYNNDGLADLYSFPDGLYQQQRNHRFMKTGLLAQNLEIIGGPSFSLWSWKTTKAKDARCSWFDSNNDGDRDLVVAFETVPSIGERIWGKIMGKPTRVQWQTQMFENQQPTQHWIEVELNGSSLNSSAIGAIVLLESSDGRKQIQQVGSAEGSLFSQGHYRLYFGLGNNERIKYLSVNWPDKRETLLEMLPADQRHIIDWAQSLPISS